MKGGRVIDPASGRDGPFDVAIKSGRVAAVAPDLDEGRARRLLDASGCTVTPGLIDLHSHVYAGVTYWGIDVDAVYGPQPVTTVVDAGSAGAMNLAGLARYVVEPSRVRVLAFLNISAIGLVHRTGELSVPAYCDPKAAGHAAAAYPELVLGIKARIDRHTVGDQGTRPLVAAARLARQLALPLMVHIGAAPPALADILATMETGDILTHCFTGQDNRIVVHEETAGPRLHAAVLAAVDRGVWLDVGHGKGSFSFKMAEAALASGLKPHVISTDLHRWNVGGPVYTLLHTMAKFLALGMSLPEVVAAVTKAPAAAIGRHELGSLAEGSAADVAVFRRVEQEEIGTDTVANQRRLPQRLVPQAVVRAGRLEHLDDPGPVHG